MARRGRRLGLGMSGLGERPFVKYGERERESGSESRTPVKVEPYSLLDTVPISFSRTVTSIRRSAHEGQSPYSKRAGRNVVVRLDSPDNPYTKESILLFLFIPHPELQLISKLYVHPVTTPSLSKSWVNRKSTKFSLTLEGLPSSFPFPQVIPLPIPGMGGVGLRRVLTFALSHPFQRILLHYERLFQLLSSSYRWGRTNAWVTRYGSFLETPLRRGLEQIELPSA